MTTAHHHPIRVLRTAILAAVLAWGVVQPLHSQWIQASLPAPFADGYYLDIMFLPSDPRYGWACSIEGYVVRTTDGGTTWQGSRTSRDFLEHIQFLTPRIGYVSGPAGIYRSDDGGATWRDITPADPNGEKGWGCYFLNQNYGVFLVGGCATGLQAFYVTADGGNSWSVSYGTVANSGLSDAILNSNGTGYAVSSGVLWRTTTFGTSWETYASTGTKVWTEELAMFRNSILLPTSGTDCDGQTRGIGSMRFSTDGGQTFQEKQVPANMFGTFLLDERTGWAAGDNASVYYTFDAGRTWELRNCGIQGGMDDIWFVNDTLGWVCGQGIYRTNFGASSRRVTLSPPDRIVELCAGDSLYVEASSGFTSYQWTDGVSGQGRVLTAEGEYILSAYDRFTCETSRDTIRVKFKNGDVPLIAASDTSVCEGDQVTLTLQGSFVQTVWSTGDVGTSITVDSSGTYVVRTIDINGCERVSNAITVVVHPTPEPVITANRRTTICLDETITLSAPEGYASYQWSNGSTERVVTTGSAGVYSVTVVDTFGCVGTSQPVEVEVLNTRNKIEVLLSAGRDVVVPEHSVGEMACESVRIRNRSTSENLVISTPTLFGNVFFSTPLHQFPIVIPPLGESEFQVCCAAVDTGLVRDTIVLSDTCSPTLVPVRSRGKEIVYENVSRCDVPVTTTVYRAGTAHRLSAPYPMPADIAFEIGLSPAAPLRIVLMDNVGRVLRDLAAINTQGALASVRCPTDDLPNGTYRLMVYVDQQPVRTLPIVILR